MTAPRPPGRVWVSTGHAHIEVNYADGRVLLHPPSVAVPPDAVPHVRAVTSPSWGTSELDAVLPTAPQAPWHWKAAALPATVATAAVLLCGRRHRRLARLARLTAIGHRLPASSPPAGPAWRSPSPPPWPSPSPGAAPTGATASQPTPCGCTPG